MLQINELTLRVAGRALIENASLVIPTGSKVGLVGRNGSGKTTLFRAISGELPADQGSISLPKGARIGRVEQEAPAGPNSLLETVLAADQERSSLLAEAETATDPMRIADIHARLGDIRAHEAESRAGRILNGLGFDAAAQSRPCSEFSGGWRMRVALAAILFAEPDLLLLDEPTNYLDLEGTLWLERYLSRYPHTAVVISHDRDLLNDAVDSIVHLSERKLTFWRGGYDSFERQFREQQILQGKQKAKQDAQRKHMEAFVERFRAKASKARQAQSRLKALAKLQPIAMISEETVLPFRFPDPERRVAPPIIHLEDVSVGYEPDRPILTDLDLRIDDDDRIALLGTNGNGKSTFAKLLAGVLQPEGGRFTKASKLKAGFFAQHQLDMLVPEQSAVEHVRDRMRGEAEAKVRSRVAQMGLATAKMDTPSRDLSGGEKARLLMGLATFDAPNLVILDEPTNHLDIDSREALVMALNEYQGAVILISHDRHLIEACADRLWLVAGGTVRPFEGDIDDYRRQVLRSSDDADKRKGMPPEARTSSRDQRREAAERREALAPIRKKIRDLEKQIETLQRDVQSIDRRLADGSLYATRPEEATRLAQNRAERAKVLAAAEDSWLKMSEEVSSLELAG